MLDRSQIEDFKDRSRGPMKTEEDSEMTTKHTPGPWLFRTVPTSAGLCHIVSTAGWRGAFIYGDGIRKGIDDALPKAQELAANARLLAAAPDLLAALQDVDALWMHHSIAHGDGKISPLHEKVIAAIARATGEQL